MSGKFSASVFWVLTAQGSCVDGEVRLAVDVGLYASSTSELSDQVDHALDGDELGPVR